MKRWLWLFFWALLGGADFALPARAGALVIVELFTSQGCSSCPAADKILNSLADRSDLLALTFPVDYWDYLGWRDTLAEPEFTRRQYAYAKALKIFAPYTPQVVINGHIDIVGNEEAKIGWAIADEQKRAGSPFEISVASAAESVTVSIGPASGDNGLAAGDATVWLVRYSDQEVVKVGHGENEDRTLTYRHVVRAIMPVGMWSGAPARIVLPRADLLGGGASNSGAKAQAFAVIVQAAHMGPILGAARLPLP